MIVLDASVVVDVVLDRAPKAEAIGHLGQELCAPAHQPAEILSALARLVRVGVIDENTAEQGLGEAISLGQELVVPPAAHLLRALALQDRIRVVDGLYVALAEERGCPLLTTDTRLFRAHPPCEVILAV